MDCLMEMNDIFHKDRARIEKNNNFSDLVKVLYPFAPKEDPMFTTSPEPILKGAVIHPFNGAMSKSFYHDLGEWQEEVNRTPISSNYGTPGALLKDDEDCLTTPAEMMETYEYQKSDYPLLHPDLGFCDELPGLTLVMSMVRNCNDSLLNYSGISTAKPVGIKDLKCGKKSDTRSLSLVYVRENGELQYGYGSIIFFGRGLVSLPDELAMYLLSNTYLVGKNYSDEIIEGPMIYDTREYTSYDRMKTACMIVYEDSLKRLKKLIPSC